MKRLLIFISIFFMSVSLIHGSVFASVATKKPISKVKTISHKKVNTKTTSTSKTSKKTVTTKAAALKAEKAVQNAETLTQKFINNTKASDKDLQAVQDAISNALQQVSLLDNSSQEYKVLTNKLNAIYSKLSDGIDVKQQLAQKQKEDEKAKIDAQNQLNIIDECDKAITSAESVQLLSEDNAITALSLGKTGYELVMEIRDTAKASDFYKRLCSLSDKIETFQKSIGHDDENFLISSNSSNASLSNTNSDIVSWNVTYNIFTQEIEAQISTKNGIVQNHNFYLVVYDGNMPLYGADETRTSYDEYTKIDWYGDSGLHADKYFTSWYAFSNDTRKKLYLQPGKSYRIGIREDGAQNALADQFVNIKLPDVVSGENIIINPTYYSMFDSTWAHHPYYPVKLNMAQNDREIFRNGCGPTSMSMVIATLADPNVTPATMADYSMEHGCINSDYDTTFDLFDGNDNAAKTYGIDFTSTSDVHKLRYLLSDGKHVAVASMGMGHFTSGGHLITLMGVTKVNGKDMFIVYDPNTNNGNYSKNSYEGDGQVINTKTPGIALATLDVIDSEKNDVPVDVFFVFSKSDKSSNQIGNLNINVSQQLINFIANYETYHMKKYQDKNTGVWKIGFGHVIASNENFDNGISYENAMGLLRNEVNGSYANIIRQWSKDNNVILSQSQFDALVDFAYSSSITDLKGSILEKCILNGAKEDDIRNAFCTGSKVDINGQTINSADQWKREMDEADIYIKGDYNIDNLTAPNGYR